ncbi:MAG: hypothetical protein ACLGH0_01490, partial [Thermoanaerobaculia bacterium]
MRWLLLLLLTTAETAVATQTYRLERIVVEGSNVAEEIVRAEARLPEERNYTEEDFRQAVYRIRRLPFVVQATYRIEPGLEAGGTTLVIRIVDETPVFLEANANREDAAALIGYRAMLDDLGIVEVTVRGDDEQDGETAALTYRAYDLFGAGAFATVS